MALTGAAACGGDAASNPQVNELCTGAVKITVGQGNTPSISWSPACRVVYLVFEDIQSGDTYWAIGQNAGFAPPVIYGTLPPGATQASGAVPLGAGHSYSVTAFRNPGSGAVIGEATFTR